MEHAPRGLHLTIVYHIEYIYNKLSTQRPLTTYVHTTGKNYVSLLLTKTQLPSNTKQNGFVSGKTNHEGQKNQREVGESCMDIPGVVSAVRFLV